LICFVGGALYIWKMPSPDQEVIALQMKQQKNQKSRKSLTEKVKQEQAQRALPANYARQLVEQSEVLVKKNLEEQVKKFQTMAETMRRRKEDMLTKVEVPLAADETGGSLFDKLAAAGAKLLVETLPKLEKGEVTPEKQPEISTTEYARMIKKEDGKIDWTKSAVEIERQIRAMSPWPSAFTKVNGKNLKIWDAKVIAMFGGDLFSKIPGQNPTKSAGKVWVADETGLHVKTGDGILVIEELQLEGKKRMKTADFLRGYAIEPGTRLGE
jgi:hypothetical protein